MPRRETKALDRSLRQLNGALEAEEDACSRQRIQQEIKDLQQLKHAGEKGKERLSSDALIQALNEIPIAEVDFGRNKYVVLRVEPDDVEQTWYFVRAKEYAEYHYMAADPLIAKLFALGLTEEEYEVLGGGRILHEDNSLFVYGYSNTYGRAPLKRVEMTLHADPKYEHYEITSSEEGY